MTEKVQETPRKVPPAPRLDPWLVFCHGRRVQNQTFFSTSENRYHVKNIPDMRRKCICSCSYGWLVLVDSKPDSDNCFLLNLISMDKIQLPPWMPNFTFINCVLTSSPSDSSSNCTVLFTGETEKGCLSIITCRVGIDNDWREHKVELKQLKKDVMLNDLTCCDGKIYALAEYTKLVTVDDIVATSSMVIEKVKGAEKFPCPFAPEVSRYRMKLVESCGELFGVRMIFLRGDECEVRGIEVFKLDTSKKIWERVKDLGNRTLFIGRSYNVSFSTSETTETEGGECSTQGEYAHYNQSEHEMNVKAMKNTVYFTLMDDKSLYAYKLGDHTIVTTLPCPNVVRDWCQPEWILPIARYKN